jgi:hypothetical protein
MQLRLLKTDWREIKNHGRLLIPGLVVDITDWEKGVKIVRPEYVLQYSENPRVLGWHDVKVAHE